MTRTKAPRLALVRLALAALAVAGTSTSAAVAQKAPAPARSAPLTNLRYEITFDSTTAATRTIKVAMSFDVAGPGPVLLSLPAWTPGAYELSSSRAGSPTSRPAAGRPLAGVGQAGLRHLAGPAGRRQVGPRPLRLPGRHARQRDGLGPARFRALQRHQPAALSRGPEHSISPPPSPCRPSRRGSSPPACRPCRSRPGRYREATITTWSTCRSSWAGWTTTAPQVAGVWTRLATYPAGRAHGRRPPAALGRHRQMIPAEAAVFQETPWPHYTVMTIFDSRRRAAARWSTQLPRRDLQSAVRRQPDPRVDHRPRDLPRLEREAAPPRGHGAVPLRSQPQPTVWLWVSEGITDYYADLAMVRGGIIGVDQFLRVTAGKIGNVAATRPRRSRTPRSPPGSIRPTAASTSTTRRARWRASCSTS